MELAKVKQTPPTVSAVLSREEHRQTIIRLLYNMFHSCPSATAGGGSTSPRALCEPTGETLENWHPGGFGCLQIRCASYQLFPENTVDAFVSPMSKTNEKTLVEHEVIFKRTCFKESAGTTKSKHFGSEVPRAN